MTQDAPNRTFSLAPGARIAVGPHTLELVAPVHSEVLSRRWAARDVDTDQSVDVLFRAPGQRSGPLLDDTDSTLSGFAVERHSWDHGESVMLFDMSGTRPLSDYVPPLPRPAELEPDDEATCHARWSLALHLCEIFEILHEIGEVLVVHADLDSFVVRQREGRVEVLYRRPELLFQRTAPPRPGSYQGTGYDAPEVTGLLSREIDTRADVFMLGMLLYTLFTGVRARPGTEAIADRLPVVRSFDPHIPFGVDACLRRALARTPSGRHAAVEDVRQELEAAFAASAGRKLVGEDQRIWVNWGSSSEIGHHKMERYPVNQDAVLQLFDPAVTWGLFAVMDGVSRSDIGTGELASWVARTTLEEGWNLKRNTPIYGRVFDGESPYPENVLQKLAELAHTRIFRWLELLMLTPEAVPGTRAMATTLSAVGIFRNRCAVCSVGDSPLYLVRLGATPEASDVEQLNIEQNVALHGLKRGVDPVEALTNPAAASLAWALGKIAWRGNPLKPMCPRIVIELSSFRLHPGDLLLVCSDGVPDAFGESAHQDMLNVLHPRLVGRVDSANEAVLTAAARALVREADRRGGRDNLTTMLVAIGDVRDDGAAD